MIETRRRIEGKIEQRQAQASDALGKDALIAPRKDLGRNQRAYARCDAKQDARRGSKPVVVDAVLDQEHRAE